MYKSYDNDLSLSHDKKVKDFDWCSGLVVQCIVTKINVCLPE